MKIPLSTATLPNGTIVHHPQLYKVVPMGVLPVCHGGQRHGLAGQNLERCWLVAAVLVLAVTGMVNAAVRISLDLSLLVKGS